MESGRLRGWLGVSRLAVGRSLLTGSHLSPSYHPVVIVHTPHSSSEWGKAIAAGFVGTSWREPQEMRQKGLRTNKKFTHIALRLELMATRRATRRRRDCQSGFGNPLKGLMSQRAFAETRLAQRCRRNGSTLPLILNDSESHSCISAT